MAEVGSATIAILPSFKGGAGAIAKGINGGAAGKMAGGAMASGIEGSIAGRAMKILAPLVTAAAAIKVGKVIAEQIGQAVTAAGSLEQSVGAIDAVFGENAGQMHAWADSAATSMGLAKDEYNGFATLIGTQLRNAGVPLDELGGKTNDLVGVGADLASMFGGTTSDAVEALSSALKGEMDPIEKYGISLNSAALDAKAAELGFDKVGGSLTAEGKAAAVMALINEQAGVALGNFGREAMTLGGITQRLDASMKTATANFGTAFLPFASAGKALAAQLMPNLVGASSAFSTFGNAATEAFQSAASGGDVVAGITAMLDEMVAQVPALVQAVVDQVGQVATMIADQVPQIASMLATQGPVLLDGLVTALTSLADAAVQVLPVVISSVASLIPPIVQALVDLAPELLSVAMTAFTSLVDAASTVLPDVIDMIATDLIPGLLGTLVGSLPALLSAGMNLFSGLVTALITAIPSIIGALMGVLPQLITTLMTMLPQLLTAGMQLFQSLVTAVLAVLPMILTTLFGTVLPQLLTTVVEMLPQLLDSAVQLFTSLVTAVVTVLPELITILLTEVLPNLLTTVLEMLPELLQTGIDLFLALVQAVAGALPQILTAVLGMLPDLINTVLAMIPDLIVAAIDLFLALVTGLIDALPDIIDAVIDMGDDILAALADIDLVQMGKDLITGLINGISQVASQVGELLLDIITDAVGGVLSFLGIHSPSRLFAQIGVNTMLGLTGGVEHQAGQVEQSMTQVAARMERAFTPTLSADLTATDPGTATTDGAGQGPVALDPATIVALADAIAQRNRIQARTGLTALTI